MRFIGVLQHPTTLLHAILPPHGSPPYEPPTSHLRLRILSTSLRMAWTRPRSKFVERPWSRWTRLARWDERTGRRCRRGSISTETVFRPTLSPLVGQFARGKKRILSSGGTPPHHRGKFEQRVGQPEPTPVEKVSSARETRELVDQLTRRDSDWLDTRTRTRTPIHIRTHTQRRGEDISTVRAARIFVRGCVTTRTEVCQCERTRRQSHCVCPPWFSKIL